MSEIIEIEQSQPGINKIETIEQERLDKSDLLKSAFNEAKSMGFDVKDHQVYFEAQKEGQKCSYGRR
jgi:uncharacterized protein (UPF0335 family)